MADCRIVNESVANAVEAIGGKEEGSMAGIALQYKNDGEAFMEALNNAISPMEGETKDALQSFFKDKVQPFITEGVPNAVKSTALLLEANRKNFEDVDKQIADSINGGGQ